MQPRCSPSRSRSSGFYEEPSLARHFGEQYGACPARGP